MRTFLVDLEPSDRSFCSSANFLEYIKQMDTKNNLRIKIGLFCLKWMAETKGWIRTKYKKHSFSTKGKTVKIYAIFLREVHGCNVNCF